MAAHTIKWHSSDNYFMAFVEAECFLHIAEMIKEKTRLKKFTQEEIDRSISYKYATHVQHAYAFELYLKCLMIIQTGRYAEGHGLLDLFELLDETTKIEIEQRFESNYSFIRRSRTYYGLFEKPSVRELLEEANRAFIDFRYLFSRKQTPPYELDRVIRCIRDQIIQLRPDLENAW